MGAGKIAFATTVNLVGNRSAKSRSCGAEAGLVKWCYTASHLERLPYFAAEGLVLTNEVAYVQSHCRTSPRPRVRRFDERLTRAVLAYSERFARSLGKNKTKPLGGVGIAALFKWQLVGLTEYRAILATDLDVDLFLHTAGVPPPPHTHAGARVRLALGERVAAFLASPSTELLAAGDVHAPINTAFMLLKPNASTYRRGLRLLRQATWSYALGHDGGGARYGTPRALIPWGALPRRKAAAINRSRMLGFDTWRFVASEGDQGLFAQVQRHVSVSHLVSHASHIHYASYRPSLPYL